MKGALGRAPALKGKLGALREGPSIKRQDGDPREGPQHTEVFAFRLSVG